MAGSLDLSLQKTLLPGLLLVSGLCGISYEVLYGRLLGNVFGDQFLVSTAVLLTFMLGIGLGAYFAHRLWRHLWLVEAGIGAYATLFALNLGGIESLLYSLLPGIGTALASTLFMGVILLIVPAFLIGASLPLFSGYAHFIRPRPEYFAAVYGLYNFAAAATVLLVEFWLVRQLGVSGAVYAVGMLNLLVATLLLVSFRQIAQGAPRPARLSGSGFPLAIIAALALSSVGSAVFQLSLVRLSELLMGPFRESFAYVLCVILLGIALGSTWVQRYRVNFSTLMTCNIAALSWFMLGMETAMHIFASLYPTASGSYVGLVLLRLSLISVMALPGAITFGATIPAILQELKTSNESEDSDHRQRARSPGYLLFVASLANAAGFLLMSLVLHQHLDYGSLLLVAVAFSAAGLVVFLLHRGKSSGQAASPGKSRWITVAALCLLIAGGHAAWNEEMLYQGYKTFHSPEELQLNTGELASSVRFKGPADVFSIAQQDDNLVLIISGMLSIDLESAQENIVGALASVFSNELDRALVLGVGSGATAGTVGLLFDEVEAVEISGVMLENLWRMEAFNFGLADMPNVTLVQDDAVHAVKVAEGKFSLILNTVTSPLFFSSSKLYTVEFLEQVKQRLAPGGLYLTWLDSRVGNRGADIMLETVTRAFEHCGISQMGWTYLLLLCSDEPIAAHHPRVAEQNVQLASYLREYDIDPSGLLYLLLHADAAALRAPGGAPLNTLDKPVLEFEMAQLGIGGFGEFIGRITSSIDPLELAEVFEPMDGGLVPMLQATLPIVRGGPFNAALKAQLREAQEHYRLALEAEQAGDCNGVIEHMPGAAVMHTRIPLLHLSLGRCYEMQQNLEDALAAYRAERKVDPANTQLALVIGRVLLRMQLYEQALEELRRADQASNSGALNFMIGSAYQGLGQGEDSKRYLAEAQRFSGSVEAAAREALLITGQKVAEPFTLTRPSSRQRSQKQ